MPRLSRCWVRTHSSTTHNEHKGLFGYCFANHQPDNRALAALISSRNAAISGDASFGCQRRRHSSCAPGQWRVESIIVFGTVASSKTSSASLITRVCIKVSLGSPRGCPKGNSTAKARGTPYVSAHEGMLVTRTLLIPPSSSMRAKTSTSLQQPGQAGVNRTPSTPSDFICARIIGPVRSIH
jgi:hypothetical protein